MFKVPSLLPLFTAVAGCQSLTRPQDFESSLVGLRCMMIVGAKPFKQKNLLYIVMLFI